MLTWDTTKARANRIKHGVEFGDAQQVFDSPHLVIPDRRADYREPRFLAIGYAEQTCLTVVFTPRNGDRHIISVRRSSHDERQAINPHVEKIGTKYSPRKVESDS